VVSLLAVEQAVVVEGGGAFERLITTPGLKFLNPFNFEVIAGRLSTRHNQLDVPVKAKTQDSYLLTCQISVIYRPIPGYLTTAYYRLSDHKEQLKSYVEDAVRSNVAHITFSQVFSEKQQWSIQLQDYLHRTFHEFGWEISHVCQCYSSSLLLIHTSVICSPTFFPSFRLKAGTGDRHHGAGACEAFHWPNTREDSTTTGRGRTSRSEQDERHQDGRG
jgi:hypothetical protein